MRSQKKKLPKKTDNNLFVKIGRLLLIGVFAYTIFDVARGTYLIHSLRKNGICTEAIVYSRAMGNRTKGGVITKYKFLWKGLEYKGISYSDTKREGKTWFNDKYIIGDTIIVVFFESDPNVNRSNRIVEKDCGCR